MIFVTLQQGQRPEIVFKRIADTQVVLGQQA